MNTTIKPTRTIRLYSVLFSALLLLSCAGLSAAPKHTGHSGAKISHHGRYTKCTQGNGHIFLEESSGYVDVTNTLTTIDGQTYVTYQGNQIAVVLNYTNYYVYDLNNNIIGYIGNPQGVQL